MNALMQIPLRLAPLVTALFLLFKVVIAAAFAVAVHRDATERLYRHQTIMYAGPLLWSVAALSSGGLIGGAVYWTMHYSTLSKPTPSV